MEETKPLEIRDRCKSKKGAWVTEVLALFNCCSGGVFYFISMNLSRMKIVPMKIVHFSTKTRFLHVDRHPFSGAMQREN